jgi:hypothetical protein
MLGLWSQSQLQGQDITLTEKRLTTGRSLKALGLRFTLDAAMLGVGAT